jgi:hypothetical protein
MHLPLAQRTRRRFDFPLRRIGFLLISAACPNAVGMAAMAAWVDLLPAGL